MQIHNLQLKNFKQYREENINFTEGLTGFIGKNGAGKSTIFEAIANAFYGRFETNKDKIRNDKASDKEPVIIAMTFEDKDAVYKIVREYRGKALTPKAELFKDEVSLATGTQEVNKRVTGIIKIDYANFKNSFFAHQKDVTSLLNLGTGDRQRSIRKMLGLEKIDRLEEKIKYHAKQKDAEKQWMEKEQLTPDRETELIKAVKSKNAEIKATESELNKLKTKVETADREYKESKEKLEAVEKIKEEYDNIARSIEVHETNMENNRQNLEDAGNDLIELKKAAEKYELLLPSKTEYEKVRDKIGELQELKHKFTKKTNLEESIGSGRTRLAGEENKLRGKREALKEFEGIDAGIENLNKLIDSNRETLKSLKENRDNIHGSASSTQKQLADKKNRKERIVTIGRESDCPECERPLGDHYDKLLVKYGNEIDTLNKDLDQLKSKLDVASKKIAEKETDIDKLNNDLNRETRKKERRESVLESIAEIESNITAIKDELETMETARAKLGKIEFDESELEKIKTKAEELKPDYERCLNLASKKDEIPVKEEEIKKLNGERAALGDRLSELKVNIAGLKYDPSKYEEAKAERDSKESGYHTLKDSLHEKDKEHSRLRSDYREIRSKLKENDERKLKIEKLQEEIDLLEKFKTVAAAFKEKITSRALPKISGYASELFTTITKGRYYNLRITEDFDFTVSRDDNEVDLNTLSGGEKDLASLCLRIAISKQVSGLAGRKNMGFLALDEVFGSQDEDRRGELLNALNLISKEFRQIFVVSHNEDVQEEFPHRILIAKQGDYSRAEPSYH